MAKPRGETYTGWWVVAVIAAIVLLASLMPKREPIRTNVSPCDRSSGNGAPWIAGGDDDDMAGECADMQTEGARLSDAQADYYTRGTAEPEEVEPPTDY